VVKNKTKEIEIGGRKTTVRQLLIDIGRLYRTLDNDFWCRKGCGLADAAVLHGMSAIIDDMRYPNEYNMLKDMGATIIRIERPGVVLIDDESEWALDNHAFDHRILNDGTVDQLGLAVSGVLR
jgi:deoxynucleotide monophosphate kinase-like protein